MGSNPTNSTGIFLFFLDDDFLYSVSGYLFFYLEYNALLFAYFPISWSVLTVSALLFLTPLKKVLFSLSMDFLKILSFLGVLRYRLSLSLLALLSWLSLRLLSCWYLTGILVLYCGGLNRFLETLSILLRAGYFWGMGEFSWLKENSSVFCLWVVNLFCVVDLIFFLLSALRSTVTLLGELFMSG